MAAVGAVACMCISLGTVQSASADDLVAGCPRFDQQLVLVTDAAALVDLTPYLDPGNTHYVGTSDRDEAIKTVLTPFIDEQVNKNGDLYVCVDYRRPVNRGMDKRWGVENYQLTNVSDNTSVGHL